MITVHNSRRQLRIARVIIHIDIKKPSARASENCGKSKIS